MGWWMLFGTLSMLIFWAVVIGLTVWAVRRSTEPHAAGTDQTPLDIARRRYARGELTHEQFEQLQQDLQATNSTKSEAA
jgi:putative membrane protein